MKCTCYMKKNRKYPEIPMKYMEPTGNVIEIQKSYRIISMYHNQRWEGISWFQQKSYQLHSVLSVCKNNLKMHENSLEMPWKCHGNVWNVPTFLLHQFECSCQKCKNDWLSENQQKYLKYMEIPLEMPEMLLEMS